MRSWLRGIAGCLFAAAVLIASFYALALWLQPEDLHVAKQFSPEDEASGRQFRTTPLTLDNPPVINQKVNYSQGENASWWPKREAPMLAELVRKGQLPPVEQRVGAEPCVMKGIEGIGNYGGTWYRLAESIMEIRIREHMGAQTLVRWSPQGRPIVPHVAKDYKISEDCREYTFYLRKGMKWSDGHPFTADDILYWWEAECNNAAIRATPTALMLNRGKPGRVEKIDDYTVKFSFEDPYSLFIYNLCKFEGIEVCGSPKHYLQQYHPTLGDPKKIKEAMTLRKLPSPRAAYMSLKGPPGSQYLNPEHPRLWPWIYCTYRPNPPQRFVRNPYYFCVDPEGNQLPYIDRVNFEVKTPDMMKLSIANGESSLMERHGLQNMYTLLVNQSKKFNYEIYHWYSATRSFYCISPNLNLVVDPKKPETKWKHQLLNDKRFRLALSSAINRKDIIRAEYDGITEPAQAAPPKESPFYEPSMLKAGTEYDPELANRLLDELGLTKRDAEGYRTFPDGTRMTFILNYSPFVFGPEQFIVDDWANVGVRLVAKERSRALFQVLKDTLVQDFTVWSSHNEFYPLMEPRVFLPVMNWSDYAIGYGRWFMLGGLYGQERAKTQPGSIEPPLDHPFRKAMNIYVGVNSIGDWDKQIEMFKEVERMAAENLWTISICTTPPFLAMVKNGFRNVPRAVIHNWDFLSPTNAGPETFYWEKPESTPGTIREMQNEILHPTRMTETSTTAAAASESKSSKTFGQLIKYGFLCLTLLLLIAVALKHPFVGRRILIMLPTLVIISMVVFVLIQLPPGDFATTKIMQLQQGGQAADLQQIEEIRQMFFLKDSQPVRYFRWLGLYWFKTFDEKDKGLLQGNMGRSMETSITVNEVVGDRMMLTVVISLATILLTWFIAIPVGIYTAVRQYSKGDYIVTFMAFLGMCIPSFLLALLLMYISAQFFGTPISGLFSSNYGATPEWTWGKFVDLLKHIWIPIVVLGFGGTGSMIRIMRANLLDEIRKPYVVAARARGVRPLKLLLKYPVRLALNPFISGIGHLFPQIVSGGAIVGMVLSLPIVGPLMLTALFSEDMYLAGSMLMLLSLLSVIGTLVSDLLLLWLDPRIRMKGAE